MASVENLPVRHAHIFESQNVYSLREVLARLLAHGWLRFYLKCRRSLELSARANRKSTLDVAWNIREISSAILDNAV